MPQIDIQALMDLFKDSIGIEAAEKIIYDAIKEASFVNKTFYSEEEFSKICDVLKNRGGFIKLIATVAATSAYKNVYYQKELAKEKKEKEDLVRLREVLEQEVEERTKQLKEAQIQMLQSAKMAAVGQLSAGVAHEINNPLGGILGYVQLVLSKLEKPAFDLEDFNNCKDYLKHIERESQRCKKIVENLLAFSRKSAEAFQPLDIKTIMENTLSILRHSLELQNIKVNAEYMPLDVPLIRGNVNQLQQVFTNIIINAQHAMPQGGQLNICAKVIQQGENKNLHISFQDTGCGIPKENLERIFEPFFTTKENWKSVGLGLSICYQIIQQHNGKIVVESELGEGSTFTLILPCEV
jgi:two-component system NtrC family sensor kinase